MVNILAFLRITVTFIHNYLEIHLHGFFSFSAVWTDKILFLIWRLYGNTLRERLQGIYWMFLSNIWLNRKKQQQQKNKANPLNSSILLYKDEIVNWFFNLKLHKKIWIWKNFVQTVAILQNLYNTSQKHL